MEGCDFDILERGKYTGLIPDKKRSKEQAEFIFKDSSNKEDKIEGFLEGVKFAIIFMTAPKNKGKCG